MARKKAPSFISSPLPPSSFLKRNLSHYPIAQKFNPTHIGILLLYVDFKSQTK